MTNSSARQRCSQVPLTRTTWTSKFMDSWTGYKIPPPLFSPFESWSITLYVFSMLTIKKGLFNVFEFSPGGFLLEDSYSQRTSAIVPGHVCGSSLIAFIPITVSSFFVCTFLDSNFIDSHFFSWLCCKPFHVSLYSFVFSYIGIMAQNQWEASLTQPEVFSALKFHLSNKPVYYCFNLASFKF